MITGTLLSHFVPADKNIDVITLEVGGKELDYFLPRSLTTQHWPFAQVAKHPQVRIKTRLFKRQDAGNRGRIQVVKDFEYLS